MGGAMTKRMPELRPCPHCGGPAKWGKCGYGRGEGYLFVTCKALCTDTAEGRYKDTMDAVAAAWNRRDTGGSR